MLAGEALDGLPATGIQGKLFIDPFQIPLPTHWVIHMMSKPVEGNRGCRKGVCMPMRGLAPSLLPSWCLLTGEWDATEVAVRINGDRFTTHYHQCLQLSPTEYPRWQSQQESIGYDTVMCDMETTISPHCCSSLAHVRGGNGSRGKWTHFSHSTFCAPFNYCKCPRWPSRSP